MDDGCYSSLWENGESKRENVREGRLRRIGSSHRRSSVVAVQLLVEPGVLQEKDGQMNGLPLWTTYISVFSIPFTKRSALDICWACPSFIHPFQNISHRLCSKHSESCMNSPSPCALLHVVSRIFFFFKFGGGNGRLGVFPAWKNQVAREGEAGRTGQLFASSGS